MEADQVVEVLRRCRAAGAEVRVAGGWAVDAVVGTQTRGHGDLDLAVDARHLPMLLGLLEEDGFTVTVDQAPSRVELRAADGRILDLHPVSFAADGSGVQAGQGGASFLYAADGFTDGTIGRMSVPCLSVEQQLRFRDGYELRPVDHHDLALLVAHRRGHLPREGESFRTVLP